MDPGLCPDCASAGKVSKLEYLLHDEVRLILCEDIDCPFNYKGHHSVQCREEAPLSPHLLSRLCPEFCPETILREPKLRYRHLMKLFWLIEMRNSDVYGWLQEEVASMAYSRLHHLKGRRDTRYQLTPSAKRMMELTDEEIQVGKHVIPDLRKIATTLKVQYEIHLLLEK